MFFRYGTFEIDIDVSDIVLDKFKINNTIHFGHGSKNFNMYFGDPTYNIVKNLMIDLEDGTKIIIGENDLDEYIYDLDSNKLSINSYDKSMMEKYTSIFTSLKNSSLIWITLINFGYVDYTKNFLKSMEVNNCPFTLIIYCLDSETIASLLNYKNCICLDANIFVKKTCSNQLVSWGQSDYKKIVFAKLDAIRYTLNICRPLGIPLIGYIDTDIVLFSNPTQIMIDAMNQYPKTSIVSQCDEEKGLSCSNIFKCPNFCSGVIAFRNTEEVESLLYYSNDDINIFSGDQAFLLKKCNDLNIQRITIARNILLNGSYSNFNGGGLFIMPSTACLVHFNYLSGDNKKICMKNRHMWYLD